MINMLKADILSLFIPGAVDDFLDFIGTTPPAQILLFAAITMEISIVMIVLSRVLKFGLNRWVNIIMAILTIVFAVGGRASYPHYRFIPKPLNPDVDGMQAAIQISKQGFYYVQCI